MSTKRRRRHTPEEVVRKLRDADAMLAAGQDVAAVLQPWRSGRRRTAAGGTSTAG